MFVNVIKNKKEQAGCKNIEKAFGNTDVQVGDGFCVLEKVFFPSF